MTDATHGDPTLAVERVFREVHGHAVASLARVLGDLTLAEDAVQDAFVIAGERWPVDGMPPNPHGWIVSTARHRGIDRVRRIERGRELERSSFEESIRVFDDTPVDPLPPEAVTDERLRLIFTCCHPALRSEHQVALTLKLLAGLSVEEIARAFLVTESTMAKRLTRAKYKIAAANVPYRVPPPTELPARLGPVLSVLYLIYNAGTEVSDATTAVRAEAIRLARAVVQLLPDEPEAAGLLALLLLNESRIPARGLGATPVLLRDQDRGRWDRSLIDEGQRLVRHCIRLDRPGPYQLQAAIQAVHGAAVTYADTDWSQIVSIYDHLLRLSPTPIVALNRAIAVLETEGPDTTLALLDELTDSLENYAPFHAARATALARTGDADAASRCYRLAAGLTATPERRAQLLRFAERPIELS